MKKKLLAALLSVAMVATVFAGCGKKDDGEVQKITWMFWDDLDASEDLITIGYKEVIDRFNETYKGKYEVEPITTNLEEYDAKLNALIAADDCPDVFICNPGPNMDVYVDNGAAADITDLVKGDSEWYSSFTNGIFERMTYDGKIMAVPTNFAAALVFYNTEIFASAGAEVPTTFDELLAACQKIKDAGYTPISCSAGTAWCLSMVAGYLCDRAGGPDNLANANAGTGSWLDPSFIDAGNKLVELSKYFQATAAGDSNDVATAAFYNEEAAMLIQGSWVIGQINGSNPAFEEKCGVFSFPAIEGGADPNRMIVKTDNLMMSAKTESKEACVALMKMFTDDTAQKYTAEVGGKMPVTNVEFDLDKAPAQLGFVMNILEKSTGTLGFYNESLDSVEAGNEFDNAMVDLFLGNCTSEEAFQKVEDFYKANVWNK